ncbi:MAG TPA: hypothetical protein VK176_07990 [Phycisphaerales bacterium]|nr:hypothetical protein [Phycisphaerales bacterium]
MPQTDTTLEWLKVILQFITITIFACGLGYTGLQFRHWRRAAYVANFTKLVELQMQLRKMRVDDPSLAKIFKHDVVDLQTDQEIREHFMNLMQLSVFEIVWFSHRMKQLPDDYYQSWVDRMKILEQEESFQKMIDDRKMKILHDDFQTYIREMTAREVAKMKKSAPK